MDLSVGLLVALEDGSVSRFGRWICRLVALEDGSLALEDGSLGRSLTLEDDGWSLILEDDTGRIDWE